MNDLLFHLKSLTRFIYVVAEEEDRILYKLNDIIKRSANAKAADSTKKRIEFKAVVYNSAFGLQPLNALIEDWGSRAHRENQGTDIQEALISVYKDDPADKVVCYIFTDPERILDNSQVVRRFLNLAHQFNARDNVIKIIIFVGSRLFIPAKLQRYVEVVHDKGLSLEEIQGVLESRLKTQVPANTVKSFQGLTTYEVIAASSQSIVATRAQCKANPNASPIDPKYVMDFKRRQLSKTDLLTPLDVSHEGFDKVGGQDRFKDWVEKNKASWTEEGQKFGLRPPKGILLMGVWGCGKSLSVKALGNAWRLPVIQMELGRLRNSLVGASEANIYRALSIIEAVSPCIVFLDEAEKGLSGGQSSAASDAGTTARMIGILSTWLQETPAMICLAMTANSLTTLPPEFVRRTNERFFFDLPAEEERVDILKIHLLKQGQDPTRFNLASLAEDAVQMVGSEIEQAINSAMVESFNANAEALDEGILSQELRHKPRIVKTLGDEIKEIVDWVGYDSELNEGIRARFASSKRSGERNG